MSSHIINFAITEQRSPVKYYPPIVGFEIDKPITFWELLELPFLDGLFNVLLHRFGRRSGLKKFTEQYPVPQNIEYKRVEINIDDIVEKTHQIVYEYQRQTGTRPLAILIGHKDYRHLVKQLDFYCPPSYETPIRGDRFLYRGMKIIIAPSIDGMVAIGANEIKDIKLS
jgi:hypothetical protein